MVHKNITFPNILTLFRVLIVPFLIITLLKGGSYLIYSLILFILASISDFYDGFLARRYKKETAWGAFLDPLADKILILSSFGVFCFLGIIKVWMLLIIFGRDLAITVLRIFSQKVAKKQLKTSKTAKIKTFLQCLFILFVLIFLLFKNYYSGSNVELLRYFELFIDFFLYLVVAITFYSGLQYFIVNRFIFRGLRLSDYSSFISELIATCFFIGYVSFAPGTLASLIAAITCFFIPYNFYFYILSIIILFIIGVLVSSNMCHIKKQKDPSCVVIDEFVGMMLTLFFFPKSISIYVLAFALFRFFDIAKVFPINLAERVRGGLGIMLDDIIAAIFSVVFGIFLKNFLFEF